MTLCSRGRVALVPSASLTFLPDSVHMVGLEGELKSSRHDTTFSHDVESIGDNDYQQMVISNVDDRI